MAVAPGVCAQSRPDPTKEPVKVAQAFKPATIELGIKDAPRQLPFVVSDVRGKGVQRGIVQSALEKNPLVKSFHDAPESHLGATVAVLVSSVL